MHFSHAELFCSADLIEFSPGFPQYIQYLLKLVRRLHGLMWCISSTVDHLVLSVWLYCCSVKGDRLPVCGLVFKVVLAVQFALGGLTCSSLFRRAWRGEHKCPIHHPAGLFSAVPSLDKNQHATLCLCALRQQINVERDRMQLWQEPGLYLYCLVVVLASDANESLLLAHFKEFLFLLQYLFVYFKIESVADDIMVMMDGCLQPVVTSVNQARFNLLKDS